MRHRAHRRPGVRADLEMICMAVDSLRACGLKKFHIEIGHAGIYRALASGDED